MNKRYLVAFLCGGLIACTNPTLRAYKDKVGAEQAYTQANTLAVNSGQMKESAYWSGLYAIATRPPVLQQDIPFIKTVSSLIDVAQNFEAGRISRQEFDSQKRQLINAGMEQNANIQAQQAAADQERRRAALEYYLRTKPVTTNCTGFGNSASCTTY